MGPRESPNTSKTRTQTMRAPRCDHAAVRITKLVFPLRLRVVKIALVFIIDSSETARFPVKCEATSMKPRVLLHNAPHTRVPRNPPAMPSGLSPKAVDADGGVKATSVAVVVASPKGKGDVSVKVGKDGAKAKASKNAKDATPVHDGNGEDIDGSADRRKTGAAERTMKQDFYRILHESRDQTTRLLIGAWFLLLTAICNMLVPYFAGRMTDAISLTLQNRKADAIAMANEALYGLLAVGLIGGVFQAARSYLFNTASYKVVARLRNR